METMEGKQPGGVGGSPGSSRPRWLGCARVVTAGWGGSPGTRLTRPRSPAWRARPSGTPERVATGADQRRRPRTVGSAPGEPSALAGCGDLKPAAALLVTRPGEQLVAPGGGEDPAGHRKRAWELLEAPGPPPRPPRRPPVAAPARRRAAHELLRQATRPPRPPGPAHPCRSASTRPSAQKAGCSWHRDRDRPRRVSGSPGPRSYAPSWSPMVDQPGRRRACTRWCSRPIAVPGHRGDDATSPTPWPPSCPGAAPGSAGQCAGRVALGVPRASVTTSSPAHPAATRHPTLEDIA